MNTEQLEVGLIVKNYKCMCELLGVEPKKANSKKAQLKEWDRYFAYENDGHKFIITDMYDTVRDKKDLRNDGQRKTEYIDYIEELLISILLNKKKLFLSRTKMLRLLEMINDNYTYIKYNPYKEIQELIDIDNDEIKDFYTTTDDLMKRNLEAALNGLDKKRLASWNKTLTVCFIDMSIEKNDSGLIKVTKHEEVNSDGEIVISFDAAQPLSKELHRKATEEEVRLIYKIEREILDEYKYKDISDVFKNMKAEKFYKEAHRRLLDVANIDYYYHSYEIICNDEYILKTYNKLEKLKLSNQERKLSTDKLNKGIMDRIEENANKRHIKAVESYVLKNDTRKITKLRLSNEYITNTNRLTETLINREAESIVPEIDYDNE